MASVLDFIDCPNCGKEAISDFYYKTGEEYINCQHCGYHYSAFIKHRNKALNTLTEEDWEIKEVKQPYGAYTYKMCGEIGVTCGTLITESDADEFRVQIKLEDHVDFATIKRVVDNKEIVEHVVESVNGLQDNQNN